MKKKKRLITMIVTMLLLFVGVLGLNVNSTDAATPAKLTVSTVKGSAGDTIKVDVSVAENPGMCGLAMGIHYDKAVLTVVEAVGVDEVFSSEDAVINPGSEGCVSYMYGGIKDKTSTGKIMTITFKINSGATVGDSAITIGDAARTVLEASNFNGDTVDITTVFGKVVVENPETETETQTETQTETEKETESEISSETVTETKSEAESEKESESPSTGDGNLLAWLLVALGISGVTIATIVRKRRMA